MSWVITGSEKTPVDRIGIQNVSLLLHGNGINGSTTFTDSSPLPKIVTPLGNAQISTAVADPFGNSAKGVIAFDGSSRISIPSASDSLLGTGDFTIELWLRPSLVNVAVFVDARVSSPSGSDVFALLTRSSGTCEIFPATSGGGSVSANTWYHIAMCRTANFYRIFIDGISVATGTNTTSIAAAAPLTFGANTAGGNPFTGYMDEIRVTRNIARYSANFTPPTAPFPDI